MIFGFKYLYAEQHLSCQEKQNLIFDLFEGVKI